MFLEVLLAAIFFFGGGGGNRFGEGVSEVKAHVKMSYCINHRLFSMDFIFCMAVNHNFCFL